MNSGSQPIEHPKSAKITTIAIDRVEVGDRLRAVDEDWVQGLALSIGELGLQNPIQVGPEGKSGRHPLIAGAHRLEACRRLGWKSVPAAVFDGSKLQRRLAEIDENLFRRELNPLDRAAFLAERKTIYEELHPETRQGAAGAAARWHANDKMSFASETAEKLGISERTVERALHRMKIAPDVRAKIAATWLADKGAVLDALAKQGPDQQRRVVALMLAAEDPARSVAEALARIEGHKPKTKDAVFEAILKAWRRADRSRRRRFLVKHKDEVLALLGLEDRS